MATIQNERDKLLQSAAIRVVAIANTSISSNVGSFVLTPSTGVITPASATITVKVDTYTAPIYQWYKFKDGVATALVGQTSSTLTVASSGFAVFVGSGTSGTYRVIVSQAGYPTETLDYTFLLVRDGAQGASGLPGLSVVAVASAFSFTFSGTKPLFCLRSCLSLRYIIYALTVLVKPVFINSFSTKSWISRNNVCINVWNWCWILC